jgi:hypothetical protein
MKRKLVAESPETQKVIRRHYEWLRQFWTPNRESYAGHSLLIADSDLGKAYAKHDPQLPTFAAAAIRVFAEVELA